MKSFLKNSSKSTTVFTLNTMRMKNTDVDVVELTDAKDLLFSLFQALLHLAGSYETNENYLLQQCYKFYKLCFFRALANVGLLALFNRVISFLIE